MRTLLKLLATGMTLFGCSSSDQAPPLTDAGARDTASGVADDRFTSPQLDSVWTVLHPELADVVAGSGQLLITMKQRAIWAGPNEAVHVWRRVRGDFRATSMVRARSQTAPDAPPPGPVRLGGLMARSTATAPPQNYVHVVVGFAPTGLSVETKTTEDSTTSYDAPAWPNGDAELGICRIGSRFAMLKRPSTGGQWQVAATFDRPDLPDELAVGPNAYAQYGAGGPPSDGGAPPTTTGPNDAGADVGPDLVVAFGPVHVERVAQDADCLAVAAR